MENNENMNTNSSLDGNGSGENAENLETKTENAGNAIPEANKEASGNVVSVANVEAVENTASETNAEASGNDEAEIKPKFADIPVNDTNSAPVMNETGNGKMPKSKNGIIIAIIVAIIVAIAALAGVLWSMGILCSAKTKITKAIANTLNEDSIYPTMLQSYEIANEQQYTVVSDISTTYNDMAVELNSEVAIDCDTSQISSKSNVAFGGLISEEVDIYFDDNVVKAQIPDLFTQVFEYNYTREGNDGMLITSLADSQNMAVEDINSYLTLFADGMGLKSKQRDDYYKKILEIYNRTGVNRIDSKEYMIDGKQCKAKGYVMVLKREDVEEIANLAPDTLKIFYTNMVSEAYDSMGETVTSSSLLNGFSKEEIVNALSDELVNNTDVTINFYIYKDKLAAVEFRSLNVKFDIRFSGGDHRASNMILDIYKGESLDRTFARNSQMEGNNEKGSIVGEDGTLVNYEYNVETGEYSLSLVEFMDGEDINLKGIYKIADEGEAIEMSGKTNLFGYSFIMDSKIKKGATITTLEGESFDVGTAQEEDMYVLYSQLLEKFGLLSLFLQ